MSLTSDSSLKKAEDTLKQAGFPEFQALAASSSQVVPSWSVEEDCGNARFEGQSPYYLTHSLYSLLFSSLPALRVYDCRSTFNLELTWFGS